MNEPLRHSIGPCDKRAPKVSPASRVRACDLFGVFNRAADEAATEAFAGGLALTLHFDPRLREARRACPAAVDQAVKAMIRAMLRMTRRGAVSLRADVADDVVTVAVASLLSGWVQPHESLFAQAAAHARAAGGRLNIERGVASLSLSLVFRAPLSPMMVLLIEPDWPGQRQSVRQLTEAGFGVDLASDGQAALRMSSGESYVAVLADLYLEEDDVLEVVGRLRSANRAAPVFALRRDGSAVAGWALAKAGFAGVVESPVTPCALRAALASVEAAELEAVQAGEDAEEDDDGQDRDHGRLVSAKVRTA
jgi:CheY-like chemotaxis protein